MNKKFGIDIGGTTVKIGYFEGEVLVDKYSIPTNKQNGGSEIVKEIAKSIIAYTSDKNIDLSEISGYGIGIPSPIVGDVALICPNIGWVNYNVREEFDKYIECDNVVIANDADVAAAGEFWSLKSTEHKNSVFYTFGTGVGGGIILNEKLVQGAHGGAGELGHIPVKFENASACGCGNKGCLETVASATGLVNETKVMLRESSVDSVLKNLETFAAKDIFDAAKDGDTLAIESVERMCRYIAIASASIAATIDPDVFILGGGVAAAGDIFVNTIKKYYKEFAMKPLKDIPFELARLGNDAGIYGAAYICGK